MGKDFPASSSFVQELDRYSLDTKSRRTGDTLPGACALLALCLSQSDSGDDERGDAIGLSTGLPFSEPVPCGLCEVLSLLIQCA